MLISSVCIAPKKFKESLNGFLFERCCIIYSVINLSELICFKTFFDWCNIGIKISYQFTQQYLFPSSVFSILIPIIKRKRYKNTHYNNEGFQYVFIPVLPKVLDYLLHKSNDHLTLNVWIVALVCAFALFIYDFMHNAISFFF